MPGRAFDADCAQAISCDLQGDPRPDSIRCQPKPRQLAGAESSSSRPFLSMLQNTAWHAWMEVPWTSRRSHLAVCGAVMLRLLMPLIITIGLVHGLAWLSKRKVEKHG